MEEVVHSKDEEVVEMVEEEGNQNFDIGKKKSGPLLPKWNDGGASDDKQEEEESYPVLTPHLEGTSKTTLLPKCVGLLLFVVVCLLLFVCCCCFLVC